MTFQDLRLRSTTGADLAVYHSPAGPAAEEPARGILIICHGLSEHALRYQSFATAMADHGFHVYAHDHRGHGRTRADDSMPGMFARKDGHAAVIADVAAVRHHAVSRHPGLPVILFGHSMGGMIALHAAQAHPGLFDALAVWNANFHPGLAGRFAQALLRIQRMLKGSDVPSQLMSRLTFETWAEAVPGSSTSHDWLSHERSAVDAYLADPLCGGDVTISLWIDLLHLSTHGARLQQLARLPTGMPVHVAGGDLDPVTRGAQEVLWLATRMREVGMRDVTAMVFRGTRHETLHDTIRDKAMADFAAWAIRAIGRRPGHLRNPAERAGETPRERHPSAARGP
jgi:alpha-beta hydrolase superfamily lysophospholipase